MASWFKAWSKSGLAFLGGLALAACSGGGEDATYDGAANGDEDFISEEELAEIAADDPELAAELRREMAAIRQMRNGGAGGAGVAPQGAPNQAYSGQPNTGQPYSGQPTSGQPTSSQAYQTNMNSNGQQRPVGQPQQQRQMQQRQRGPSKPLPAGAHRVKRFDIVDRNGFEKPMTAYTVMLPVDWRSEGGVVWGQAGGCGGGQTMNFSASSPDGRSGMQVLPAFNWAWNNFSSAGQPGGCPFMQINNVQQYLQYLVSQTRQGAQIVDFRLRQDISKGYNQLVSAMPMPGGEMRTWVEAGEVLIRYNANGADMRETIAAVVIFNYNRMDDGTGMGSMEILSAAALPAYAMRAPNGQLDFNFTELVRKSFREAPQWGARMARHNAKIAAINNKGARDRSRITAQTGSDILDMQMDSWRKQNASSDRTQRESVEAIHGVETYNDPYNGGTVQLDNTYENAWQMNDGSYVLTDDTNFEPYRDLGIDGQRLEVTQ